MIGMGNVDRVASIRGKQPEVAPQPTVSFSEKLRRKRKDKKRSIRRNMDRDIKLERFKVQSGFTLNNILDVSNSRVEDLLLLITGICSSTSVTSALVHVVCYIKTYNKDVAMVEYLVNFSKLFFEEFFSTKRDLSFMDDCFHFDASDVDFEDFKIQSGSEADNFSAVIQALRNAQENWLVFKEGPYFKHLMCLFSFISTIGFLPTRLSFGEFSFDLFKIFKLRALDLQSEALNIFEALFSTIYFFVSRGYEIYKGCSSEIMDSDIDKMDKEFAVIVGAENLVNSGKIHMLDEHVDPQIKSRHEFDLRLQQLITKMQYYRKIEHNQHARKVYDDKIIRLHKIKFELLRCQNENHFRECPYSFMISGSSSIGKSTLNSILITAIANTNGIEAGEGHKVVVNEQDKYDSDIQAHTTIITLDDFGNMKPDKTEDPPTRRIIDLINNMTKTAVKADVSEKGSVTVNPKIVTITTNTADLHASYFSVEPVAIMRRLNVIIVPQLRPSHMNEYGGLKSEVFCQDRDAWTFDVYKIKIVLSKQGNPMYRQSDQYEYVQVLKQGSIHELINYVNEDSKNHFAIQREIVTSYRENINNICQHCGYPSLVCLCKKHYCDEAVQNMKTHGAFDSYMTRYVRIFQILCLRVVCTFVMCFAHVRYKRQVIKKEATGIVALIAKANRDALIIANYYDKLSSITFRSVYEKIWKNAAILILGATTVSAFLLYRKCKVPIETFESIKKTADSNNYSIPKAVVHGATESKESIINHWKQPEFTRVPRSSSSIGITPQQLITAVSESIAVLRVAQPDLTSSVSNIIPLKGNYWLAPGHMFKEDKQYEITVSYSAPNKLKPVYTGSVSPSCWTRVDGYDFVVLQLVFAGDQPNLMRFFCTQDYLKEKMCLDLIFRDFRDPDQNVQVFESITITPKQNMVIDGRSYKGCVYRTGFNTYDGLCMATFITKTHSPMIVGFHLAGNDELGIVVPVNCEIIQAIMQKMSIAGFDVHSSGNMELDLYEVNYKFSKEVHFRSPVNFLTNSDGVAPSIKIYGSHGLGRTNYNSAVVTTFISDDVARIVGVPNKHGPPPLRNLKVFWHQDLDKITHDSVFLDHKIFGKALVDLDSFLLKKYDMSQISSLAPLDLDANLAGLDGVYGIDSLNLKTSMGFPLNCPKHRYIVPSLRKVQGITRPLDLPNFIRIHIEQCEEAYLRGERCYPIMKTTMKDEPTVIGKQKRRLFQASPCWYIILLRKYFLPIGAYIQKNRLDFCTAVGANAHCSDWDKIAKHLSHFGSGRYIAGDYKSFDKKMPAAIIRAGAQFFMKIADLSGNYSKNDLMVMQGLITDLIYPVLEYDGVIISLTNSHCSGNSLTVLLNNFANLIYMRMAYYTVYASHDMLEYAPNFDERVNILVYGDDNVAEISLAEKYFNHTSCAEAMKSFGVEYTMADKDSESIPYVTFEDISFLKRKFRFEDTLGAYVAPLELDSIYKSLHCMMRQKNMEACEREIVAGNIRGAMLELWMHGRDYYDEIIVKLWEVVVKHDLQVLVGDFLSYEDHIIRYISINNIGQHLDVEMTDDILDRDLYPIHEMQNSDEYDITKFALQSGFCKSTESYSSGGLSTVCAKRPKSNFRRVNLWALLSILLLYINFPINNQCLRTTKSILRSEDVTIVHPGKENPQAFHLQSGRETFSIVNNSKQFENVSYNSASPGFEASVGQEMDSTFMTVSEEHSSIAEFLSRPVLLDSITVNVGASLEPFFENFNPWSVFLLNTEVARKIANYKLLRATMRLKFEVNGTPFQYGKIMVTYDAYEKFATQNIVRADASGDYSRVIPSQRMKVILNPASSVGAEMVLPFFFDEEYIELNTTGTVPAFRFGTIRFSSLSSFGATNGSIEPMSIKVFGMMENVVLTLPTFAVQSGYETGIVSKPATAVAAAAKALSAIPYITPYMKATEYAASAIARIAALFGYSKPTVVADEMRMVPFVSSNIATCNGVDTTYKLAIDGKNELTIDPRTVGLSSKDELAIANIAGIESFYCNVPWGTESSGTVLASMNVTPMQYRVRTGEGAPRYYFSASCTVGAAFTYWRGSCKFRFVVNSSNFHRGRLKIVWEPKNIVVGADPSTNASYSHIIDLNDTDDFSICVGWGATSMFLRCLTPNPLEQFALSDAAPVQPGFSNGRLSIYVVNPLRSSSSEEPAINISVFTSMCDDVEFAVPNEQIIQQFSPFSLQSGIEKFRLQSGSDGDPTSSQKISEEPNDQTELVHMSNDCLLDNSNLVYFGEKISSIRMLIKRYNYVLSDGCSLSGLANTWTYPLMIRWKFLGVPGADDFGLNFTTGGVRYNFTNWSYLLWFKLCYAGWRGSIRYKALNSFVMGPGGQFGTIMAGRVISTVNNIVNAGGDFSANSRAGRLSLGNGSGVVVSSSQFKPLLEFEIPYYRNNRISAGGRTTSVADDEENFFIAGSVPGTVNGNPAPFSFDIFIAGGEDFTYFYWMGPPILYTTSVPSAATGNPYPITP